MLLIRLYLKVHKSDQNFLKTYSGNNFFKCNVKKFEDIILSMQNLQNFHTKFETCGLICGKTYIYAENFSLALSTLISVPWPFTKCVLLFWCCERQRITPFVIRGLRYLVREAE